MNYKIIYISLFIDDDDDDIDDDNYYWLRAEFEVEPFADFHVLEYIQGSADFLEYWPKNLGLKPSKAQIMKN